MCDGREFARYALVQPYPRRPADFGDNGGTLASGTPGRDTHTVVHGELDRVQRCRADIALAVAQERDGGRSVRTRGLGFSLVLLGTRPAAPMPAARLPALRAQMLSATI